MTQKALLDRIFAALRALPLISMALMLGGGLVATAGLVWIILLVGHAAWLKAAEVDVSRVNGLVAIALGLVGVIVVVMITLAWGRPDKISGSFGGAAGEIDFPDRPSTEPLP